MPTLKKIILVVLINIIVSPVYAVFNISPTSLPVNKTEYVISYCFGNEIEQSLYYEITLGNGIQWGNELTSASLSIENALIAGGSVGNNMVKFLITQNVSPNTCINLSTKLSWNIPESELGTKFDIMATLTSATGPEYLIAQIKKATLVNVVGFCANVTEIPQVECETLVKFYDDTGGDNWTDNPNNNWKLTNIPCSWDGISCVDGRVAAIERINKNLIGSLPNLSGLLELQTINLSDNKLDGPIPSIRDLVNLKELNLKNNKLSSSIPDLSTLNNMQVLELQNNKLESNIPFSITNLTSLTTLNLGYNKLTADVDLQEILQEKYPNWGDTQTVLPETINITAKSPTTIEITWEPITYTADIGYYQVKYSTISGSYNLTSKTDNKTNNKIIIDNLSPATKYYFILETITKAHGEQQNDLTSASSAEFSKSTLEVPIIEVLDADNNIIDSDFNFGNIPFNNTISKTFTVKITNNTSVNLSSLQVTNIFTTEGNFKLGIITLDKNLTTSFDDSTTFTITVNSDIAGTFEGEVSFQYGYQTYKLPIIATVEAEIEILPISFFEPEPNSQLNITVSDLDSPYISINILQDIEITDISTTNGENLLINIDSNIITIQCNLTEVGILEDILEISYLVGEEIQQAQYPLFCEYGGSTTGPLYSSNLDNILIINPNNFAIDFIEISNKGDETLEITAVVDDNNIFQVDSSLILIDEEPYNLEIQCTLKEEKEYTATLTITTNDPNQEQITYTLKCTEILDEIGPVYNSALETNETLDIGNTILENTISKSIQISNFGDKELEITAIIEDDNIFQVDSSLILINNELHDLNIQCTPTEEKEYTTILTITTNDPNQEQIKYTLKCTGIQEKVGPVYNSALETNETLDIGDTILENTISKSIQISNFGDKPLEITAIIEDNNIFQVDNSLIFINKESHDLTTQCTPTEEKEYTAILTITTNDPNQEQIKYTLKCTGIQEKVGPVYNSALKINETLDIGDTILENTISKSIKISNFGDKSLEIIAIIDDDNIFQVDNSLISINKEPHDLTIQCTPTEEKEYTTTLTITTNDPNQEQIKYTLKCTGIQEKVGPVYNSTLKINGTLDIGDTILENTISKSIKIFNIGDKSLEITAIITDNNVFQVDNSLISIDKEHHDLKIQCTPTEEKEYTATLTITTNNPNQEHITYTLKCIGITDTDIIANNFEITGEIRTQAGVFGKDISINAPEKFKLIGQIEPDPQHIEQVADIIVTYHWKAFDDSSSLSIPIIVKTKTQLQKYIEVPLFEGTVINMAGIFEVEFGYRFNGDEYFIDNIAKLEVKPNQPPTAINLTIETGENNLLGTLSTVDSDQGDEFIYSLLNFNNYFKIQADKLYVTDIMPQFETVKVVSDSTLENTYPIKIQTTDSSGTYSEAEFIIQFVTIKKPSPIYLTKKSVTENYLGIVGRVWTDTPDYDFELLENDHFWLDDSDILRVKQPLDFENGSSYKITINDTIFKININNMLDATVHGKIFNDIEDFIETTDLSELIIQLVPDIEHQTGIKADILAIVIQKTAGLTNAFILNTDVWQEWDGMALPKFTRLILEEKHDLELFESAPFSEGELQIYVGYQLDNGQLIYDLKPVTVEIVR